MERLKVFITGGTGSWGQALMRRLLRDDLAERIVCYSRDEAKQAQCCAALGDPDPVRWVLGDVRDKANLIKAMWHCDSVVHLAALKRVDQIAYSPHEAIKTNVEGSINVVDAAIEAGVCRVLLISSDKACQPTNLYGLTKALMEGYATHANVYGVPRGTRIAVARFGNALASRGSVVELWRAALAAGKPLPLTHPDCTRFWLTLEEAVDLILQCLAKIDGGEIFVPKIKALRLLDLADAVAGRHVTDFKIVGLRPGGEKLHETLVSDEEARRAYDLGWAYLIKPHVNFWRRHEWPGEPIDPKSFCYRSDWPPLWMTPDEMRRMVRQAP